MNLEPFIAKWVAFKWEVIETNGHDMQQIIDAIRQAKAVKGKPTVIVAHTIKGKGVSYMENNVDFHGKAPTNTETEIALKELS
jgi:transketolase